ncbi:MAG: HAMP domain-containing histidine kinase [Microcystis sp. M54BS1]|uniref:sensor histidine kinase n=1 Tax=unclassified Microcystis TaxID=2643300 RepID=UPI0022BDDD3F|nr:MULTISPECIES: HAMP domain-containing sensor histidine kinase [unclassified Microcystis]MCA2538367.1 HAMP domain-containing histidine kinase [Microcystis sp. M54BS1]MCA2595252.1 HAMP domain-containing histidine kinase [Microcystis sp. M38BS1]MCA2611672.1 HAMP domain-containing histidine kinase [Microcystis sp. M27BS1]MCA2508573.1 HAMP domain-containing histidine kinase [Microcystis sp. M62BS1]MCA2512093.1 HAMP domain-containing histidine kinase [Microcystis sp. M60BS1]
MSKMGYLTTRGSFSVNMDDIEALKRELQQTRLAYQMAVAINHLKSSFLGRVAHELRSPLSSMISIHQMILADLCESPAEEREFIAQGQLAGRKLMAMLDEMINLSKLESGTIPLEREIFSLTKLWQDWASLTYLQAANRNIQLKFSPLTDDIAIIADYQCLSSALVLLVDAAIANLGSGSICISVSALDEKKVTIVLEFPGEIPLWQMPEISPLSLESKLEEVKQFTQALGLSPGLKFQLAKGIIEVSGGEMSLDQIDNNSQDKLTRIVFSLPRSPDRKTPRDND